MNDRMKIATQVLAGFAADSNTCGTVEDNAKCALQWADALIQADKDDQKANKKSQLLAPQETSVLVIPTNQFNTIGETFAVTDAMIAQWKETFPGVDVMAEVLVAKTWCMDNPEKRKTTGGMRRFLGNWLKRAQDKGGSRAGVASTRGRGLSEDLNDTSWAE